MRSSSPINSAIHLALLAACSIVPLTVVRANPEAAPWGSANPGAEENCFSCHLDYEPQYESAALAILGLPDTITPGGIYDLVIAFDGIESAVTGFQLIVSEGQLQATDGDIEAIGGAARSTMPRINDGAVAWRLTWRAPAEIESPLVFYLAASASNDDNSPLGDIIHFRTIRIP